MCGWRTQKKGGQANQALGRSKGRFSTKIHAATDALGHSLKFLLTGGQQHDITQAPELLQDQKADFVIADRGYDANELIELIDQMGAIPVIPPRKNRTELRFYDGHLYKERHLIECFFNKLKYYRRIFSRFDKLASRYLGFIHFAAALIWLS